MNRTHARKGKVNCEENKTHDGAAISLDRLSDAQQAKVTSLMSKDLTELPGKEVLMITVEYAPGELDPIHRHNAQAFVYVLEG